MLRTLNQGETPGVETLRLSAQEWRHIIKLLRSGVSSPPTKRRHAPRRNPRREYFQSVMMLAMVQTPDLSWRRFMVRTVDLSEEGLGFVHGGYVHIGSPVSFQLVHHQRGPTMIDGKVRHCAHLMRHIHRVGVQFDEPIVVGDYLLDDASPTAG